MPIYEYRCRKCGNEFERLVLPTFPEVECPSCQSSDLEKLISGFAVSSDTIRQANAKSSIKDQKKKHIAKTRDEGSESHHHDH